jgi:hypothetical protein
MRDYQAQDKHPSVLQTEYSALKKMKLLFSLFFRAMLASWGPDSEYIDTVDTERLVYKYIFNNFYLF